MSDQEQQRPPDADRDLLEQLNDRIEDHSSWRIKVISLACLTLLAAAICALVIDVVDVSEILSVGFKLLDSPTALALISSVMGLLVTGSLFFQYIDANDRLRAKPLPLNQKRFLRDLAKEVVAIRVPSNGESQETSHSLIESLQAQMSEELSGEMAAELERRYGTEISDRVRISDIERRVLEARDRLQNEVSALARRGNLNLFIGTATTVAAVFFLLQIVFADPSEGEDWTDFLPGYLQRLAAAVFIQVFAFFFLRQYRTSLDDIKYFQNEITNVELKAMALTSAMLNGSGKDLTSAIKTLATTERNGVLKKGETTGEIERRRLDVQSSDELISSVAKIVDAVRSQESSK